MSESFVFGAEKLLWLFSSGALHLEFEAAVGAGLQMQSHENLFRFLQLAVEQSAQRFCGEALARMNGHLFASK